MWDKGGDREYDLWTSSKEGCRLAGENNICAMMSAMNYQIPHIGYRNCHVLPLLDINGIMDGSVPPQHIHDAFRKFDEQCTAPGSGCIVCLRGANRSGLVVVGYIMAKTGVGAAAALAHLKAARPIVDISRGPKVAVIGR